MLTNIEFVRQSLELNLLYLRLFKEHLIFFSAALNPKEYVLVQEADALRCELDALLLETIRSSGGMISPQVLASGELITQFTINAERATEFYTGIPIDTELSRLEHLLCEAVTMDITPSLVDLVFSLNQHAMTLGTAVANFKQRLLHSVQSCQIFIAVYPSLIEHTLEETRFYLDALNRLQNREEAYPLSEIAQLEGFWNHIMEEHAEFLRGFLDPAQETLFDMACQFVREFDELTKQAQKAKAETLQLANILGLTLNTLEAMNRFREFKAKGTEGQLECKVRAIAAPLLTDHVLREASFYLRLLNRFISKMH